MAWGGAGQASGIFVGALSAVLGRTGGTFDWLAATNKLAVYNNSETPNYTLAIASAIYATTNEVSGTGWAAGGIAYSALAVGSTSLAPTLTASGSNTLSYGAANVSVATTTLASPGAFGCYLYSTAATAQYRFMGIYFGGTGYITTGGTFQINWSGAVIATVTCAV